MNKDLSYCIVLSSEQLSYLAGSKYGIDRMKILNRLIEATVLEQTEYSKKGFAMTLQVGQAALSEVELSCKLGYDIDLHPTWFCLSDLIMESTTEYRMKAAGRLDIRIHKPGQGYMAELDTKRVKQILNNFLSNALKHTQEGYIDITYGVTEQGIEIKVTDTGCGIPQDKLPVIFERFEKVDSFTQGVGLGLPICKSIAECMGGSIGLTSEVGVGTTVWVTLPCSTAPTPKLYKEKLIDNFYS